MPVSSQPRKLKLMFEVGLRVALLAMLAFALATFNRSVHTRAFSPAGFWHGTGYVRRSLDAKYFTESLDYDVDFWFSVDGQGNVEGRAVMRYAVSMDDQKLRALLTWAHSMGTASISSLPEIGTILGTGKTIGDVVGLRLAFDEAMPTRSGRISGRATGGTLHLQWAEAPQGAQYKIYREYPTREVVMSSKQAPAINPWPIDAKIQTIGTGQLATVPDSAVNRSSGDTQIAAYWSAVRVGD